MIKLDLIGRLTKDSELKVSASGKYFLTVDLAVNIDKNKVEYIKGMKFGENVANIQQYLTKGKQVWLSGTPTPNAYTKQDGTVVASISVFINQIEFVGSNNNANNNNNSNNNFNKTNTKQAVTPSPIQQVQFQQYDAFPTDDDIPF